MFVALLAVAVLLSSRARDEENNMTVVGFCPPPPHAVKNEQSKVTEASEEHKEARQLIGRIRNTQDEDHLTELMTQLEEAIQHHVREEESEMLPKARRELPPDRLAELGEQFEHAKESAA